MVASHCSCSLDQEAYKFVNIDVRSFDMNQNYVETLSINLVRFLWRELFGNLAYIDTTEGFVSSVCLINSQFITCI